MKYKKLLIIFLLPLFLTGCINYTELNELGIIESMGIEKKADEYLVSVNMIDAKSEHDESDELRKTYEATGRTITEAIQNIYLKSSKKVYLSHIEVLLLSEEVAKNDISHLVDFFLRNQQSRNAFTTIVVKDTTPKEIIKDTKKNPEINDILRINSEEYGITSLITFEDFSRMLLEDGVDAILPVIKLDNERLEVDGYAYFKNQDFSSYLTKKEAFTYNLLKNKNSHIVLTHDCDSSVINVKLDEINTKIKSKKQKVNINITGNITITENNCKLKEKEILNIFEKELKTNVNNLINKQETENFDILGMQSLIRQNNYIYYQKEKKNLLNKLSYKINTNLTYKNNENLGKDGLK